MCHLGGWIRERQLKSKIYTISEAFMAWSLALQLLLITGLLRSVSKARCYTEYVVVTTSILTALDGSEVGDCQLDAALQKA